MSFIAVFRKCFIPLFCMVFIGIDNVAAQHSTNIYTGHYNADSILTPAPGHEPRINGPLVYGCRPGDPFLYKIPCQGKQPIHFSIKGLPEGLKLNSANGIITGKAPKKGEYKLLIRASNASGKDKRELKIIVGDKLALTPPMGWSSWYVYFSSITGKKIRKAAAAMVSSGMANVGYQYINIDDCWTNINRTNVYVPDSARVGPPRDSKGNILPNVYFSDMKSLTQYIHSLGLKAGIYSSPGPHTCTGMTGSYGHVEQDARQFAKWGFDFLKYDWCSYGSIAGPKPTLEALQKPYIVMGNALQKQHRDIVYSLCQYGMGDVWKWGPEVGGNMWRTGSDLGYNSALDHLFEVALKNAKHGTWSKPGGWNNPDFIQIGWVGSQVGSKFNPPSPSTLTANEQYAYMSLWCVMASPLIYSGEMTKLDKFTLNVLCNPEIIAVDQDPLGKSAKVLMKQDSCFIMVKELVDGSKSVGLFNKGEHPIDLTVNWKELQIKGKQHVRDLWREKNIGVYRKEFTASIPPKGVVMLQLSRKKIKR